MDAKLDGDIVELTNFIKRGERRAFAYKTGNCFIGGCALYKRDANTGHFSYFAVKSDMQCNGIGSSLLEYSIEYFIKDRMNKMSLHVNKDNIKAIKLYEKYVFSYAFDITDDKIAMMKLL